MNLTTSDTTGDDPEPMPSNVATTASDQGVAQ